MPLQKRDIPIKAQASDIIEWSERVITVTDRGRDEERDTGRDRDRNRGED